MLVSRAPVPALAGGVSSYYGFEERTGTPLRRREGPGVDPAADRDAGLA